MPSLGYHLIAIKKQVSLSISRGTSTGTTIFWFTWTEENVEGWGEAIPFGIDETPQTIEAIVGAFALHQPWLERASAWERYTVEDRLWAVDAPSAFIAAVTQAMHDWWGKKLGQPMARLIGIATDQSYLTSVTIGIAQPAAAAERVRQWLALGLGHAFKVKLGSPDGIEADKAMFGAVQGAAPSGARLSVDANGGWKLAEAIEMAEWLSEKGVDHLEQPLARGDERHLPQLQGSSPLPIFVDESCRTVEELPALVPFIAGINIKLMKCGGLNGAFRLIHVARAFNLRILVGCYGSTALGNTCAALLAPFVDYLDLDSHLNLQNDPFRGVMLREGRLHPFLSGPGFGVTKL